MVHKDPKTNQKGTVANLALSLLVCSRNKSSIYHYYCFSAFLPCLKLLRFCRIIAFFLPADKYHSSAQLASSKV